MADLEDRDPRLLPARCDLPVPPWPSGARPSPTALEVWGELWVLPVAVWWHQQGTSPRVVQRYVVVHLDAVGRRRTWPLWPRGHRVAGDDAAALERALGLTPDALDRLNLQVDNRARLQLIADGEDCP